MLAPVALLLPDSLSHRTRNSCFVRQHAQRLRRSGSADRTPARKGVEFSLPGDGFKTSSGRHRKVGPSAERRDVPESTLPGCAKHVRWEASVIGRAQRDVHEALEQSTGASVLLRRYFELKRGEPCAAT